MSDAGAEVAHAKINLALHVRARNPDGYHAIETLFAFAADGDLLRAEIGEEITLSVTGPFAPALAGEGDNLVLRAARALRAAFGIGQGAAIHLDKHLPVASGIGGGSADAAATLRLLTRLWGLPGDDPSQATLHLPRGRGAIHIGDAVVAEQEWLVALDLAPAAVGPRANLITLYTQQGRLDDAAALQAAGEGERQS